MRLYSGSSVDFIDDATRNQIESILTEQYTLAFGRRPSDPERHSWSNSLVRMKDVLSAAKLRDNGILLEYQLPWSSRRLDFLTTGTDPAGLARAEIIELKQWDRCDETFEPNEVLTEVGRGRRVVLHPSVQVAGYEQYLRDAHSAFYGSAPIELGSSAYLHNFRRASAGPLFSEKFADVIATHPLYLSEDFDSLVGHLSARLGGGHGLPILKRIEDAPLRPSRKLMSHVAEMIRGVPIYRLLDEQQVAFDTIVSACSRNPTSSGRRAIIVKGGPGTGKSVIALNLMAKFLDSGMNARYATGSKAFTETLHRVLGSRAAVQFDWTHSYSQSQPNSVDLIVVDEAHRIRAKTTLRYLPKSKQSGLPQVQEIMRAARVSAYFVDDLQGIRPNEVGSSTYIRQNAELLSIPVTEIQLESQFRCKGADQFVRWVDSLLGFDPEASQKYVPSSEFTLEILDSPVALASRIRKASDDGKSARIVAGFCWDWSDPLPDGSLRDDVRVADFHMPWNAKPGRGRLGKGIPKASLWGTLPGGIDQVGCVYTAQGFEFDCVGVIVGPDLGVVADGLKLAGRPTESADPGLPKSQSESEMLIRRAYRVLFTRAMEGCFVYFTDPATREFVQSRLLRKA
jgi:uncharacterized protein